MNTFGPSKCPRCDKTVYAAEQIMGPGRQVYHKSCLKCTSCNKRLDSYSLVEHNQEPYCKPCHVRGFGTRDLRQHNLSPSSPPGSPSSRNDQPSSPPPSIDRFADRFAKPPAPQVQNDPPLTPPRTVSPATEIAETETPDTENFEPSATEPAPLPNATESLETSTAPVNSETTEPGLDDSSVAPSPPLSSSPTRAPALPPRTGTVPLKNTYNFEYRSKAGTGSRFPAPLSPSAIKKGSTGFAALRAGPPSPTRRTAESPTRRTFGESPISPTATGTGASDTPVRPISFTPTGGTLRGATGMQSSVSSPARPLSQTPTGIRPMMTGGSSSASPVRPMMTGGGAGNIFGGRVECPRCGKAVYHAEQVSGPGGRKYHKLCLRCVQCNSALNAGKLTEKDGEPMCRNCYSKTYGPQGSGYALIGRAG